MTGTEWWQPPRPAGVRLRELTAEQVDGVLADVFGDGRRCRLLEEAAPGERQWLLAELGDGRVTGTCPAHRWRRSDHSAFAALSAAPPQVPQERWRVLEVLVFCASAQVRVGEAAAAGWLAVDEDHAGLPEYLRPRDRRLLLAGRTARVDPGEAPFTRTREPSGTTAVLPLDWGGAATRREAWLSVREYWARDAHTGAVGVAFHRLTGMATGERPTRADGWGDDRGT
ncbi:hypothetical protein NI17_004055 [Thermobifida halotolerans]|uniref:Uncharacterized protein n=1 Tax=Thermobifida halotolerans TaxID=483545 RepID=A0A399G991_9ACTN|nr:CRISPR-associated protein Csx19 [Thermobifida halotolerans]UOE20417.1 hypothetical protein NI17_004055 [Thermobifida halotolerans]